MGQKKVLARRQERKKHRTTRTTKLLLGNLAYVFLGCAVLFAVAVIVVAGQHVPPSTTSNNNNSTQPDDGWIPLTSKAPGAIIAAARKSALFNVDRSGDGDYLKDITHLETPVLVHALQVTGSVPMPDYYIIPIDDRSGMIVGAAELELNATYTAVQVSSIVTYTTPRPHGHFAQMPQTTAQANVAAQRHTAIRHGAQPQLVYFPVDANAQQTGAITWKAGGESPADPIWLIPGADGQDYIVGTDGRARTPNQLPIMKQP